MGVERGAGHAPGGANPPQAVGQTRAGRGGGTHRCDLRRPKGPKVSVLASSSSTCMVNSPIRFMALSSSACTGSPCTCLRRGVDPADPPDRATARAGTSLRPTGRDRSCSPARHAKAAERPHACAPPSIAGQSQRACRQSLAWGTTVDEPSSPAFTTGPSTATFFSKLSVMFRSSLDTSIKPILCPRKSGPTHSKRPIWLVEAACLSPTTPAHGGITIPERFGIVHVVDRPQQDGQRSDCGKLVECKCQSILAVTASWNTLGHRSQAEGIVKLPVGEQPTVRGDLRDREIRTPHATRSPCSRT